MNELTQALIAESYAAAPTHILEGLTDDLVHRELPNVPHTIYAELWHVAFWQWITLHWIDGIETPYPIKASDGFPQKPTKLAPEPWEQLRHRFLHGCEHAAAAAQDTARLDHPIRCPSRPSHPLWEIYWTILTTSFTTWLAGCESTRRAVRRTPCGTGASCSSTTGASMRPQRFVPCTAF